MSEQRENPVQSVDRAIIILESLAEEKDGSGITRLSQITGLHKSTVHRLLAALMSRGYVEKNANNDNYKLGMRVLYLASKLLDGMDVRMVSRPYIENLSRKTNEVIHLAVLDNDEAVYIDKVESQRPVGIRMYSQIGKRVPLYCTAVGKVLLSGFDSGTVERIIKRTDMIRFTANTITDYMKFTQELDKVREQGYAFDEIEHEEGIRCVAVPIYNQSGKIIASISISGPTIYVTKERIPELKRELLNTANEISFRLGYISQIY